MKMNNLKDSSARTTNLDESHREFAKVEPYESHSVTNPDKSEECELLIIISEEYNPDDPDTFKYEG